MKRFARALVTGGAGFIGSHLVDRLMQMGFQVKAVDDLSGGRLENVEAWRGDSSFEFVQGDLKDGETVEKVVEDVDVVFHFAANAEVRVAEVDPAIHFSENLVTTFNVLEAMRKSEAAKLIVFPSSSTVYGEPVKFPTAEDYGPLAPVSVYGASKLGCEALISAYSHTFSIRGLVLRLANIVGSRSKHGVVVDFIRKLREDPGTLEVLGDGSQTKSYLHVEDLLDALFVALKSFVDRQKRFELYNVGSADQVNVRRIAMIVGEEMVLKDLRLKFSGGVDGGRGWKGDVKNMFLSSGKLASLGWKPRFNSEEAVRLSCRELLK